MKLRFDDLLVGGAALGIAIWGVMTETYFLTIFFGGILGSILVFKFLFEDNTRHRRSAATLAGLAIALGTITSAFSYTVEGAGFEFSNPVNEAEEEIVEVIPPYIPPKKKEEPVPEVKEEVYKETAKINQVEEEINLVEVEVPIEDDDDIDDMIDDDGEIDIDGLIDNLEPEEPIIKKAVEVKEPEIFVIVEEMPEFIGGDKALMQFIADKTKYPAIAKENGMEGVVFVEFIVMEDGSIENIKTVKGQFDILNKEAMRVIRLMPKWKPGKQRGKAVRVKYNVPVRFRLE